MIRLAATIRPMWFLTFTGLIFFQMVGFVASQGLKDSVYQPGELKPIDSRMRLKAGDPAPQFTLPSISGEAVSLKQYRGSRNVVLSFVPAAFTPICSEQWPGYNVVRQHFEENDTILLGITTDNIPTLYAWTQQMGGVWFPVLSDFWPHGKTASKYGVLRSDGTAERAVFLIDKEGIIRYISVHDINARPNLESLVREMEKLSKKP